jgi:hypothetical protein
MKKAKRTQQKGLLSIVLCLLSLYRKRGRKRERRRKAMG